MINRISIILLIGFFLGHATGMDACIWNKAVNNTFSRVIVLDQDLSNQQNNPLNDFSNTDSEEEVKEEACQTELCTLIAVSRSISEIHPSDEFLFSNYLLELVSPPPEV